jgi:hypothetical protein
MLTVVTQNSRLRRSPLSGDGELEGGGEVFFDVGDAKRYPEVAVAKDWAHIAALKAVIFYPLLYAYARMPFRELVGEVG